MVIVSIKGYEKSPAEWSIKARIVFRGDAARNEENQAAVFDELAASAPTSLGGLNLVITFGLLDGHTCSTSDCIKAYVQSFLDSSCPTYVLLPAELVPDYARHMYQPVAPLIRSLYGHPLASASWQNHLSHILSTHLGGQELEEQPGCFHFPSLGLALSVYVDDLTVSGPKKKHFQFCTTLRKYVQLEESRSSGSGGSRPSLCKFRKAVTIDFALVMRVDDPPAKLRLSLYVDSGLINALQGIRSLSSFGNQKLRGRFQDRRRSPSLRP